MQKLSRKGELNRTGHLPQSSCSFHFLLEDEGWVSTVVITRLPILMPDTRWRLHTATEKGTAEPEGKGQ